MYKKGFILAIIIAVGLLGYSYKDIGSASKVNVESPVQEVQNKDAEDVVFIDEDLLLRLQTSFKDENVVAYLNMPAIGIGYSINYGEQGSIILNYDTMYSSPTSGNIFVNYKDTETSLTIEVKDCKNEDSLFRSLKEFIQRETKGEPFELYTRDRVFTYDVCTF